jgi:hypothetical protein
MGIQHFYTLPSFRALKLHTILLISVLIFLVVPCFTIWLCSNLARLNARLRDESEASFRRNFVRLHERLGALEGRLALIQKDVRSTKSTGSPKMTTMSNHRQNITPLSSGSLFYANVVQKESNRIRERSEKTMLTFSRSKK